MATDLPNVSTAELQAELSRRKGVRTIVYGPNDNVWIADGSGMILDVNGPIIVTINVD
jgi:hypothetical protein